MPMKSMSTYFVEIPRKMATCDGNTLQEILMEWQGNQSENLLLIFQGNEYGQL